MKVAQEGDLVLLIGKDKKSFQVVLERGGELQTHQGILPHDDILDQPLGRQVCTHLGRELLVMQPSTADLIRSTKRTTQIMFPKDIGYLLLRLNIYSGARVIEAGTGSGGLTIALARAVQPEGTVYTYDQRADIQQLARGNLARLRLDGNVQFVLRHIGEGFIEREVDAVFLDVRDPWSYLPQTHEALGGGGFFGAILPTTNQVSHLLHELRHSGFASLEVEELVLRPYKPVPARLRPMDRMVAHTGYLVFARKIVDQIDEDWFHLGRGRDKAEQRGDQDNYW